MKRAQWRNQDFPMQMIITKNERLENVPTPTLLSTVVLANTRYFPNHQVLQKFARQNMVYQKQLEPKDILYERKHGLIEFPQYVYIITRNQVRMKLVRTTSTCEESKGHQNNYIAIISQYHAISVRLQNISLNFKHYLEVKHVWILLRNIYQINHASIQHTCSSFLIQSPIFLEKIKIEQRTERNNNHKDMSHIAFNLFELPIPKSSRNFKTTLQASSGANGTTSLHIQHAEHIQDHIKMVGISRHTKALKHITKEKECQRVINYV